MKFRFLLLFLILFSQISRAQSLDMYSRGAMSIGVNNSLLFFPQFYVSANPGALKFGLGGNLIRPDVYHLSILSLPITDPSLIKDKYRFHAAAFLRYHLFAPTTWMNFYVENWNQFGNQSFYLDQDFQRTVMVYDLQLNTGINMTFWDRFTFNTSVGVALRGRFRMESDLAGNYSVDRTNKIVFAMKVGLDVSIFLPKPSVRNPYQ
jgi:hypothetical protein